MDEKCPHGMGVTCPVCQVEGLERGRDELRTRLEKELLGVYRQRDEFRSQVALLRLEVARLEALNATLRRQAEEPGSDG